MPCPRTISSVASLLHRRTLHSRTPSLLFYRPIETPSLPQQANPPTLLSPAVISVTSRGTLPRIVRTPRKSRSSLPGARTLARMPTIAAVTVAVAMARVAVQRIPHPLAVLPLLAMALLLELPSVVALPLQTVMALLALALATLPSCSKNRPGSARLSLVV